MKLTLFTNAHARRRAAFVLLLVWLFTLATGIAHACLLEAPATRHDAGVTPALAAIHARAPLVGNAGVATSHNDGSGASRAQCLKVSADGSRLAPKTFSGIDHTDPGPAPLSAVLWNPVTTVHSSPRRIERSAPGVSALPIRIRFARLAL